MTRSRIPSEAVAARVSVADALAVVADVDLEAVGCVAQMHTCASPALRA